MRDFQFAAIAAESARSGISSGATLPSDAPRCSETTHPIGAPTVNTAQTTPASTGRLTMRVAGNSRTSTRPDSATSEPPTSVRTEVPDQTDDSPTRMIGATPESMTSQKSERLVSSPARVSFPAPLRQPRCPIAKTISIGRWKATCASKNMTGDMARSARLLNRGVDSNG